MRANKEGWAGQGHQLLLPLSIIFKYTRAIIGVNINNASVIKGLGLQSCRDFLLMVLSDYHGIMWCDTAPGS